MNIWTPDSSSPPVSVTQIHAWEQQNRLRMPSVLRAAMLVHNGGTIADSFEPSIDIRPLEEWEVVDEDDLELFDLQKSAPPYITFADNDHGGTCVLNYHRCTAAGEPSVITLFHDGLDQHEGGADMAAFIASLATVLTDKPAIDGGHAAHLTRLAQTQLLHRRWAQHCLLGRDVDGRLIHMDYFNDGDDERWTTTFLPEPLKRSALTIDLSHTEGVHGYELGICPQQSDAGREWTSSKTPSGRWKNDFTEGSCGGASMQSQELEPLILLRQLLAGPPQTQAQAEADMLRIEYLRYTAACNPKERKAAQAYREEVEFKAASDGFDKSFGLDDEDLAEEDAAVVGEAADFLSGKSGMLGKLQDMVSTLSGGASSKVPEAIQRLIDRMVAAEAAVEEEES